MLSWLEFCIVVKNMNMLSHSDLCKKHGHKLHLIPMWMALDDFIVLRKSYRGKLRGYKGEMIRHRIRICENSMVSDKRRQALDNKHSELQGKLKALRKFSG